MATFLEESEKTVQIDHVRTDLVKKIVKIGPVDPERIDHYKNKGRTKLMQAKYKLMHGKSCI